MLAVPRNWPHFTLPTLCLFFFLTPLEVTAQCSNPVFDRHSIHCYMTSGGTQPCKSDLPSTNNGGSSDRSHKGELDRHRARTCDLSCSCANWAVLIFDHVSSLTRLVNINAWSCSVRHHTHAELPENAKKALSHVDSFFSFHNVLSAKPITVLGVDGICFARLSVCKSRDDVLADGGISRCR